MWALWYWNPKQNKTDAEFWEELTCNSLNTLIYTVFKKVKIYFALHKKWSFQMNEFPVSLNKVVQCSERHFFTLKSFRKSFSNLNPCDSINYTENSPVEFIANIVFAYIVEHRQLYLCTLHSCGLVFVWIYLDAQINTGATLFCHH